MLRINDTNFYKELEKRNDDKTEYYKSYIIPLESNLIQVLENNKCLFPNYPDHGIQHSLRILQYVYSILPKKFIKYLSSLDIVVLIFAAFFHDTGMGLIHSNESELELIRVNHALKAKEVIELYFNEILKGLTERDRIKNATIFVCEAHGMDLKSLVEDKRFTTIDEIGSHKIRYGILSFLLRIGDLLDLEEERTNNFRMIMLGDSFSEQSYNHNRRHQKVLNYVHDKNDIKISVEAENIMQYQIWYVKLLL